MLPLLGLGAAASALTPLASGLYQLATAEKQKKQGQQLRQDAKFIQKEALRPEFNQKLALEQALAAAGLPGMQNIKSNIDQQVASNIGNIQQTGDGGAQKLAALTAMVNKGADAMADLGIQDAEARKQGKMQVANTLWGIGQEERGLEQERTRKVENQLRAAAAMENAGTANTDNAIKSITGGASNAITSGINSAINFADNSNQFGLYNKYLDALMKQSAPAGSGQVNYGQYSNPYNIQLNGAGYWK